LIIYNFYKTLSRVHIVAFVGGFWVYPFLEFMPPLYKGIFFVKAMLVMVFFYKLGEIINHFYWSPRGMTYRRKVWKRAMFIFQSYLKKISYYNNSK
jgi:hypothetical protein